MVERGLQGTGRGERDGELGGWPRFCFVLGRAETEAEGGKEENGNRGPATDPEVIGWEDPFQRIKRGMQGKSGIKEKKEKKKEPKQVTHSHSHTAAAQARSSSPSPAHAKTTARVTLDLPGPPWTIWPPPHWPGTCRSRCNGMAAGR